MLWGLFCDRLSYSACIYLSGLSAGAYLAITCWITLCEIWNSQKFLDYSMVFFCFLLDTCLIPWLTFGKGVALVSWAQTVFKFLPVWCMSAVFDVKTCVSCPSQSGIVPKRLNLFQGWNCRGVGLNPPPPSSCLQTLIFEWKSTLYFNPWARETAESYFFLSIKNRPIHCYRHILKTVWNFVTFTVSRCEFLLCISTCRWW